MNELDKMVEAPAETVLPPLVRFYKTRKEAGDRLAVELYWPNRSLGLSEADLVIHRQENGKEQPPQQLTWDDELNTALVNLGIRAIDLENEGQRFALGIRAALRKVERDYGDGYLNAVFVELIDESDLVKHGEIADVRKYVYSDHPERTQTYNTCRELIAN